ncbi:hypothetical protein ABT263_13035 [Kitasatospora sp. NPDC001603]
MPATRRRRRSRLGNAEQAGIFRPSSRTFALSNAHAGQADSVFQILG